MATLKICVQKQRKDGYYPVYVRVTHRGKQSYIRTDKMVGPKGINPKTKEIKDAFVIQQLSIRVVNYMELLNKRDISNWTVEEVVSYLKSGDDDVSFSKYCRKHHDWLVDMGQARNARNYELAYQHFERYMGTTDVKFSALTSAVINNWIKSLSGTNRAKELYPICLRQVFRAALLEYNDYDTGRIRIKTNPWMKVRIPKAETPEKRAITPKQVREFFLP